MTNCFVRRRAFAHFSTTILALLETVVSGIARFVFTQRDIRSEQKSVFFRLTSISRNYIRPMKYLAVHDKHRGDSFMFRLKPAL